MPLLDARETIREALETGAAVPLLPVSDSFALEAALAAAEAEERPLALGLPPVEAPMHEPLAAAAEVAAERARVPVILWQDGVADARQAAWALNRGTTAWVVVAGLDEATREAVTAAAEACGAALLWADAPTPASRMGAWEDVEAAGRRCPAELPLAALGEARGVVDLRALWTVEALPTESDWRQALSQVLEARARTLLAALPSAARCLERLRARAGRLLRRPVDHAILFNVEGLDEAGVRAMLEEGARVLGPIAGVRDLAAGVAIKEGAAYRYHWMVRFAHEGVVPYYRDHPDHVAFADGRFRPVAGNRVSIDYLALARARGGRPLE